MNQKEDSEEMFMMVGNDPSSWLDQARLLKTAAQVQYDELKRVQAAGGPPSIRSTTLLAHMQAYMMLTGFSFENLIKAILVSRAPTNTTRKQLAIDLWDKRKGHLLTQLVPSDIMLSETERELLERLQIFTIWAGRYPLPMNSQHYHSEQDKLRLHHLDITLIENLFFKLVSHVLDVELND